MPHSSHHFNLLIIYELDTLLARLQHVSADLEEHVDEMTEYLRRTSEQMRELTARPHDPVAARHILRPERTTAR